MSLAVGKKGRAAIVARPNAKLFDGTTWANIDPVISETLRVEIFFGRDNEPRLLGHSTDSSAAVPHYRRHLRGRWQPAADELGRLGTARTALYGVLGHDDPEVVCAVGELCLVKRLSGWKTAPAHSEPASLRLVDGAVFALRPRSVERLEANTWLELTPRRDWQEPLGIWADARGNAFGVERGKDILYRLVEGKWQPQTSPIQNPKAVWGRSASDVWLVGEKGAAHFDGARWSCLQSVPGPLDSIVAAADEVWFSGASGAFRSAKRALAAQ